MIGPLARSMGWAEWITPSAPNIGSSGRREPARLPPRRRWYVYPPTNIVPPRSYRPPRGWALKTVNRQSRLDGEDAPEDGTNLRAGDPLLQRLNRCRGLMGHQDLWPADIGEFARAWTKYKREANLLDFCDLIERSLQDVHAAPGRPAVIFADEAQDLNPMQARLIRKWGDRAEYFVLAGDDDQTIYSFLGAS